LNLSICIRGFTPAADTMLGDKKIYVTFFDVY